MGRREKGMQPFQYPPLSSGLLSIKLDPAPAPPSKNFCPYTSDDCSAIVFWGYIFAAIMITITIIITTTIFIVRHRRRQPYARVHFGSSGRKSGQRQVAAKLQTWPLSPPVGCYMPNIHPSPYYSTIRLMLIYRPSEGGRLSLPRHCSKCAARAQSCVSQWFSWKTLKLLSSARFEPGISRAAGKRVTTDNCDLQLFAFSKQIVSANS